MSRGPSAAIGAVLAATLAFRMAFAAPTTAAAPPTAPPGREKAPASEDGAQLLERQRVHEHRPEPPAPSHAPTPILRDGEREAIERLLERAGGEPRLGQRMKTLSAALLGRPYLVHPLIGSPTEPERLVVRVDRFDCVTFLETVLALAGAKSADDFVERLRQVRYEGGVVSYPTRLHYMTDWNASNVRRGFLSSLTEGAGTVEQPRTLSLLPGFAPRTVTLRFFPKAQLAEVSPRLQDGDLISFVSARKNLDIFHVGLIVRDGETVILRHAALSQNRVLDQNLADFARLTRMLGFVVTRPVEGRIELQRHRASGAGPGAR